MQFNFCAVSANEEQQRKKENISTTGRGSCVRIIHLLKHAHFNANIESVSIKVSLDRNIQLIFEKKEDIRCTFRISLFGTDIIIYAQRTSISFFRSIFVD